MNLPFYLAPEYNAERPLLIYGFGASCLGFLPGLLSNGIKISAIFDVNPKYHNMFLESIPILPPQNISDFDIDCNVFISTIQNKLTFTNQFKKLGFKTFYYTFPLEIAGIYHQIKIADFNKSAIEKSRPEIDTARALLADSQSVEIFDARLNAYRTGEWDKLEQYYTKSNYFQDDIFTFEDDEVFADCGAFDGSTVFEFSAHLNNKYNSIYSFEPSELYCTIANRKLELANIKNAKVYRYALCGKVGTVNFDTAFVHVQGGAIKDSAAGLSVPATTIDFFFSDKPQKPTFIKMDIEGAEVDALEGARGMITSSLPKLAICAYHKLSHLWEVPLKIHELQGNGQYEIYLRHHASFYDTVCYATQK